MADFSRTWESIKKTGKGAIGTAKTLINDSMNSVAQNAYTKDSTDYRNNVQPFIYPGSNSYKLPEKGEQVGERMLNNGHQANPEVFELIDRLQKSPYRPKYKKYIE